MAEQIILKDATAGRIGVSIPTLDRMVREGRFPRPIKIAAQRVGWREATVDQWILDRESEAIGGAA